MRRSEREALSKRVVHFNENIANLNKVLTIKHLLIEGDRRDTETQCKEIDFE
jgi:hypothetical protein